MVAAPAPDRFSFITKPMVKVWEGLLRRAIQAKAEYNVRCDQIEQFYSGMADFMWSTSYMTRFMGGANTLVPPRFKITINKAFEYVAVMKPMLFWQMANRKVSPHRTLQIDPVKLFGIRMPQDGEQPDFQQAQLMQYASQLADQQAMEDGRNAVRAEVLEHILNYFPREQPGGGLSQHIDTCLDEALLYGAGFLATEHYRFPQSERTLVKSVHVPVADVFVDPDCVDPLWLDAKWIAIRHRWSSADVEAYFNLAPGSMKNYGQMRSPSAGWQVGSGMPPTETQAIKNNLIEWFEVYSRAGCGNQLIGSRQEIEPEFDAACDGNCAYICFTWGCPYPLNLPSGRLAAGIFTDEQQQGLDRPGASQDWVTEQLRWPTEYWRDDKWPVTKLTFYPHSPSGIWPQPPLAACIGELTAINILTAAYVQIGYDNREQIIACASDMADEIVKKIRAAESPIVIGIDAASAVKRSVGDMIQFMQRQELNKDVPNTITFLMGLIEQRTGMTPRVYGMNAGAVPRSAADAHSLNDSTNLRPEYMRKRIAEWQSAVADLEVFCAYEHVSAEDIAEVLGPLGMEAWRMLVTNEDPEAILRGCKCYVEASEMARPNHERDAAFLDRMQQVLVPVLTAWMNMHNDPGPLNGFLKSVSEATDIDVTPFLIPQPEPDSETVMMQQQMQQAELAKVQAEASKMQAEAQNIGMQQQNAAMDAQIKAQSAEHSMSIKEREATLKAQQAEHQMAIKQMEVQSKVAAQNASTNGAALGQAQDMRLKQQQFDFDTATKAAEVGQSMTQRREQAVSKILTDLLRAKQQMTNQQTLHEQAVAHNEEKRQEDARHGAMILASKMMMAGLQKQEGA